MNKKIPLLSLLLLAVGCDARFIPSGTSAVASLANVPVHAPARFQLSDFENAEEVIVQFKPGREVRQLRGLAHAKAMDTPGRYRLRSENPAALAESLAELRRHPDIAAIEPNYRVQAAFANDAYSGFQWALPKIQVPESWPLIQGGPLVAVLDTGIDAQHPDLAGQVVRGYDFANDDADPTDDHGHGTHVAGIVAALANNEVGIAGVAPRNRILAVKVLGTAGGTATMVADGIRYAVKQGARIINLSLGMPYDSFVVREAVQQAVAAGCVVVGAAGNDNTSAKFYPAAYPGVLAVGATTSRDARAGFSNYGDWLAIAAPGESILSTVPGGYAYMSGTSMAAPHVSAAAALVMGRHPEWGSSQVREALVAQGDAVTGFEAAPAVRRLDTYQALGPVSSPSPSSAPSASPAPERTKPGKIKQGAKQAQANDASGPGLSPVVREAREAGDGRSVGAAVSGAARAAAPSQAGEAPGRGQGASEPGPKNDSAPVSPPGRAAQGQGRPASER